SGSVAWHRYEFSEAVDGGDTITKGNTVATAPRNVHNLAVGFQPTARTAAEVELNYLGGYFLDASNQHTYPGHTLANARVRYTIWIWVLALLSLPGAVAYIVVEILPELFRSRTAQRTARGLKKAMDPQADPRRYENEMRVTGNVASRQRYAEELSRHGRYDEAITQYRETLTGLYEHDPNLMLGLARAQFSKGEPAAARATLDELIRLNPDFRSAEGQLLYARALEAEGNIHKALEEYQVL